MKNSIIDAPISFLTIGIIVVILSSCNVAMKGEGELTLATRNIDTYNSISLQMEAEVIFTDSLDQSCMISAQENLMPFINLHVKSGKLIIASDKNFIDHKPITIYLSGSRMQEIENNGSGSISSTNTLKASQISLRINGSGNIEVDVVSDKLSVDLSGSGKFILKGNSNESKMDISGSGVIDAFNHQTGNCQVEISGSGEAHVLASGELKAGVSGSGNIRYRGNPAHVMPTVSGSGSIEKAE